MANTTTSVNMSDTREVVIEPEKPDQPRLKQYVALKEISFNKKAYQPGQQFRLTEADAMPFLAANHITPLEVAIRSGVFPRSKETVTEKIVETVTGENIPDTPAEVNATAQETASGGKKSFLGNALRDAILKKKSETNPELTATKIDADKLAAIKAGGLKK